MKHLYIIFFLILIVTPRTYAQEKVTSPSPKTVSILFIGNSLTYTNNLPKLVQQQATQQGIAVKTTMIAFPNYALEDHWNDGKIQQLISNNRYDFVIIQQGPSSQKEGRTMLLEYGEKVGALCSTNQAKLCYFMVWPSLSYYHTFDGVIKNHHEAARRTHATLLPVGEVWKKHFDTTGDYSYYGPDGFHPSLKGSKIAAKVIVSYLFDGK